MPAATFAAATLNWHHATGNQLYAHHAGGCHLASYPHGISRRQTLATVGTACQTGFPAGHATYGSLLHRLLQARRKLGAMLDLRGGRLEGGADRLGAAS